jgi:Ca2+-binding EF-hand superfamily protein
MVRSGVKDPTEHQVSKVMRFYDFNRDGYISLREVQSGTVTGPEALIRDAG